MRYKKKNLNFDVHFLRKFAVDSDEFCILPKPVGLLKIMLNLCYVDHAWIYMPVHIWKYMSIGKLII